MACNPKGFTGSVSVGFFRPIPGTTLDTLFVERAAYIAETIGPCGCVTVSIRFDMCALPRTVDVAVRDGSPNGVSEGSGAHVAYAFAVSPHTLGSMKRDTGIIHHQANLEGTLCNQFSRDGRKPKRRKLVKSCCLEKRPAFSASPGHAAVQEPHAQETLEHQGQFASALREL